MQTLKLKVGAPHKMPATDRPTFDRWMARCDAILIRYRGLSIYDLPDVAWRVWFDAGVTPIRAVNRSIRSALGAE